MNLLFDEAREEMVFKQLQGRDIRDPAVLNAMRSVPRESFVPAEYREESYADRPLPIGSNQTISQPYMVAKVAELLELKKTDRILEIGSGCGYQAAVLSKLCSWVYGIEYHLELAIHSEAHLRKLDIKNVSIRQGDGKLGWPEEAPFDAILVSCATPSIVKAWEIQLCEGGRIVYPKIESYGQTLYRSRKGKSDWTSHENLFAVSYVPLL